MRSEITIHARAPQNPWTDVLTASARSTPVWGHSDGFGAGALLGLGVGAVLASGSHVVVGAPLYAAPAPVVVYEPEPQPVYVVPEAR